MTALSTRNNSLLDFSLSSIVFLFPSLKHFYEPSQEKKGREQSDFCPLSVFNAQTKRVCATALRFPPLLFPPCYIYLVLYKSIHLFAFLSSFSFLTIKQSRCAPLPLLFPQIMITPSPQLCVPSSCFVLNFPLSSIIQGDYFHWYRKVDLG